MALNFSFSQLYDGDTEPYLVSWLGGLHGRHTVEDARLCAGT